MQQDSHRKIRIRSGMKRSQRVLEVIRPDDLRQHFSSQTRFVEHSKSTSRLTFGQDAGQLFPDAFLAYLMDFGRHRAYGSPGVLLDRVTQPGAKPYCPENTKLVFFEACMRIADGAHDLRIDVFLAMDVIDHAAGNRIIKQAIDGEIAAQDVLLSIGKNDACRPAAVDISLIGPKGRNLEGMPPVDHEHNAELRTDTLRAREYPHDRFGTCTRCNVVVGRLDSHYHVADTASHEICLMSVPPQFPHNLDRRIRFHTRAL